MKSADDFYVFEKWLDAPEYAFGSKNKAPIVPREDKEAYGRIFSDLTHAAELSIGDRALRMHPKNFSPEFGSRGHCPVDLWASVCALKSESLGNMPQVYAIASNRGLEIGFSASINEADYFDPIVKARNRSIVPIINSKLPAPDSPLVADLDAMLVRQGGWHFNTKNRLVARDDGFDKFHSVSNLLKSLKTSREASGGGTVCRLFGVEKLGEVDIVEQFMLTVQNFSPLIEICSPTGWDNQIMATQAIVQGFGQYVPFDPATKEDGRSRTLALIAQRQGQSKFRKDLMKAYEGRCAISETSVPSVLEAAHITPYLGQNTNHVTNGILLRADIHTLFDLYLIKIDPITHMIMVSPSLLGTEYFDFNGHYMRLPANSIYRPSELSLNDHFRVLVSV